MPRARRRAAAPVVPAPRAAALGLLLALAAGCTAPVAVTAPDGAPLYPVQSVVDGDTLRIAVDGGREVIRLIGIDAPETGFGNTTRECFGREARSEAQRLLGGRRVRVATDPSQDTRDRYDRLLAYVWLEDGTFVNQAMIERGFAFEYTFDLPYRYQAELRAAEERAREAGAGLWAPGACEDAGAR